MKTITSTFRSSEPALQDLLRQIHEGKIQLPDFQRGWVWDDEHIRDLIASVSMAHPIGAVMVLQTGGDVQFQPRPLEGADEAAGTEPESLILDGQQRMTSLYLSLCSKKPVNTRDNSKKVRRFYYLDIDKCLDPAQDRFDAVVSVSEDKKITDDFGRKVKVDLNDPANEYEHGLFPLNCVFDPHEFNAWRMGYSEHFGYDRDQMIRFNLFETHVLENFRRYRVPVIELLRDTPKEAVCHVFEKLNTGGVTLTVFELVTAIYAAENFNLREDWKKREQRLHQHAVLQVVDTTLFLQAVTLMASYRRHRNNKEHAVTCKRKDILKLTLDEYKLFADRIEEGFRRVALFLHQERVFDTKVLPYTTQLVPLAAICAELGSRCDADPVRQKLAQWYWCGVFGELYGGANETQIAADLPEVLDWVNGGEPPRTVRVANFNPIRLTTMQTRNSAAYKGVMALLMQQGGCDWLSGYKINEMQNYFDLAIDIHHIFPRAYCEKQKYTAGHWNCVINKTPLSARTNRILSGRAPSKYLESLEKNHGLSPQRIDQLLAGHLIHPDLLRQDDFRGFLRDRAKRLLDLIEKAMGKTVSGRDSQEVIQEFGGPLI